MRSIIGWTAILIAVFAAAIGFVPGAASLAGLAISMSAVVLSLFSIGKNGRAYFRATTGIVVAGILLLNDSLRIWNPVPMPTSVRICIAGLAVFVLACCSYFASRLNNSTG